MPRYNRRMPDEKKILIIATGGTIESYYGKDGDGGKNAPYHVPLDAHTVLPEALARLGITGCDVHQACMRDSKDVNNTMILHIADYIAKHEHAYDGIVIVHGTDTMPRNGRSLEDVLASYVTPAIPIVITGAMTPLRDADKHWRKFDDSDGWNNLGAAVEKARNTPTAGISVLMDSWCKPPQEIDKHVETDHASGPDTRVTSSGFGSYDVARWLPLTPPSRGY